jgi:predicted DNA-binding transcriptional regulator AlpA
MVKASQLDKPANDNGPFRSDRRRNVLPVSLAPRGLSRVEAAAYIGVSTSLFDEMVRDGRMPRPKRINSRTVWDRHSIDAAFQALPGEDTINPWDEALCGRAA